MKYLYLIILLSCGACSSTKWTEGVPNLFQVDPGIWRGGQPLTNGWKYLFYLGLTNDLKLNEECLSQEVHAPKGIVFWIPISTEEQIFGLSQTKLRCIIEQISPGMYIHCEHGQDRTGLIVACYRVKYDHWTKQMAEKEMLDHGFHKSLFGLWSAWKQFNNN